MYKFLPSYVGSKKYWINFLQKYNGEHFIELFCGSAVLSANLAKTAILIDNDEYVCKILSNFDKLEVPKGFTQEDYFESRKKIDWWKYAFCLQKMSFSGVFRYSKNGYNVPVKKTIPFIEVQEDYKETLIRWKQLNPLVICCSYEEAPLKDMSDKVVISDPPYEGSQASYNFKFDYDAYWKYLDGIKHTVKALIVFDRASNFKKRGIPVLSTRKMRVNGSKLGDIEAIAIFEGGKWVSNE